MWATNFIETEMDIFIFLGQVRVTAKAAGDTIAPTLQSKYSKTHKHRNHSDTEEHAVRRSEGHSVIFCEGFQPYVEHSCCAIWH